MRKRFEVWLADYFWRPEALQVTYYRKISALEGAKRLALATGERHVVMDRGARVAMACKFLIERDGTLRGQVFLRSRYPPGRRDDGEGIVERKCGDYPPEFGGWRRRRNEL